MHLPALAFEERPFALQLVGRGGRPMIFGLLTGFALGWPEVALPDHGRPDRACSAASWAASSTAAGEDGFIRGLLGGLVYGSFILLGPQDRRHRGRRPSYPTRRWAS